MIISKSIASENEIIELGKVWDKPEFHILEVLITRSGTCFARVSETSKGATVLY